MEHAHKINGVEGMMQGRQTWPNGQFMHQSWKSKPRVYNNGNSKLAVKIRFDDNCKNGHSSFAITASGYEKQNKKWMESIGGCCHDEITKVFPELEPLIKWHLHSTDGPMHGVANGVYHAGERNFDAVRRSFPMSELSDDTLHQEPEQLRKTLTSLLPAQIAGLRKDIEAIGFEWTD